VGNGVNRGAPFPLRAELYPLHYPIQGLIRLMSTDKPDDFGLSTIAVSCPTPFRSLNILLPRTHGRTLTRRLDGII
jgi:hypothetical protein